MTAPKNTAGGTSTDPADIAAELNDSPASQGLRAEIDRAQEVAGVSAADAELAARDATIAQLSAQLAAIRAQGDGAAELAKAFAALQADVARMQQGQGLIPVPQGQEPDPHLYWARLADGSVIELQHPNVTHWHVDGMGAVPVRDVWAKDLTAAA